MHSRYQFIAADNICHAFSQVFGQTDHEFITDGYIHRLDDPKGRSGNKACWYLADAHSGVFGSWREVITYCFNSKKAHVAGQTHTQLAEQKQRIAEQQQQKQQVIQQLQFAAQQNAQQLWAKAQQVSQHPYLTQKQLPAFNLRQYKDDLLVPLFDADKLINLQRIAPTGSKRFLPKGRVKGCYSKLGVFETDTPLLICEGWATGATLHMQYELPVACAMFAGNLLHVAQALRARYPTREIILCADDDRQSQHNAGVYYASLAAQQINAGLAKPTWPAAAPPHLTDFNDLYVWLLQQGGLHHVA